MGFPHFALLLWIPISLVIAAAMRSPRHAFLWIFLGGSLLLPERMHIEIPLSPPIDKHAIVGISAWLAMVLMGRGIHKRHPQVHGGRVLLMWVFISSTATWLGNRDTLVYGPLVIPGHGFKEVLWATSGVLLKVVLPYTLGQSLFKTTDDLKILLKGFATAGLMYAPLVLAEARFAPFLHQKLYGYFQHDFVQSRRADGFRAFVFMSHGLSVAYFTAQALMSTVVLKKNDSKLLPIKPGWATLALTAALISCKSMASMVYAGIAFLLVTFTAVRAQVRFAAGLSIAVVMYPIARFYGLINTDWFVEQAAKVSDDRAGSLGFRFLNEDLLLGKAIERSWFGWGWWARNRVYNLKGEDTTVPDGEWIVQLGHGGIFKFIIIFGLLLLPIWRCRKVIRKNPNLKDGHILTALALMLSIQALDLIPNATSNGFGYLIAGSLAATCINLRKYGAQTAVTPTRAPG